MDEPLLRLLTLPLVLAEWKPETWDGTKKCTERKNELAWRDQIPKGAGGGWGRVEAMGVERDEDMKKAKGLNRCQPILFFLSVFLLFLSLLFSFSTTTPPARYFPSSPVLLYLLLSSLSSHSQSGNNMYLLNVAERKPKG